MKINAIVINKPQRTPLESRITALPEMQCWSTVRRAVIQYLQFTARFEHVIL